MQLEGPLRTSILRTKLGAAACMLLASGMPATLHADPGATTTRVDANALLYGEQSRADVVEPTARVTRLFANGQSLSAQIGIDVITGASPSGAMPSGRVQTTTSASGTVTTNPADQIPTVSFQDVRAALDLEWTKPFGSLLTSTTGAHFSREKDYQSLGANVKFSVDVEHRLTTLTAAAGFNQDGVFPQGGTPIGLSDGSALIGTGSQSKQVTSGLVGISHIFTRRWMMAVNASRTAETGYLTEPYKVVSLLDGRTGFTVGQLTENRPSTRQRADILTSSVYHLTDDVVYLSHRYYWDDWGVRSNTFDFKYRHELENNRYVQPHLRFYSQTPADFFRFGLIQGVRLPEFATSDYRLGPLRTLTLGGTYGFQLANYPGQFSVRAEYMRQWGDGHPPDAAGVQRQFDLFPALAIGSVMVGYSVQF